MWCLIVVRDGEAVAFWLGLETSTSSVATVLIRIMY